MENSSTWSLWWSTDWTRGPIKPPWKNAKTRAQFLLFEDSRFIWLLYYWNFNAAPTNACKVNIHEICSWPRGKIQSLAVFREWIIWNTFVVINWIMIYGVNWAIRVGLGKRFELFEKKRRVINICRLLNIDMDSIIVMKRWKWIFSVKVDLCGVFLTMLAMN